MKTNNWKVKLDFALWIKNWRYKIDWKQSWYDWNILREDCHCDICWKRITKKQIINLVWWKDRFTPKYFVCDKCIKTHNLLP